VTSLVTGACSDLPEPNCKASCITGMTSTKDARSHELMSSDSSGSIFAMRDALSVWLLRSTAWESSSRSVTTAPSPRPSSIPRSSNDNLIILGPDESGFVQASAMPKHMDAPPVAACRRFTYSFSSPSANLHPECWNYQATTKGDPASLSLISVPIVFGGMIDPPGNCIGRWLVYTIPARWYFVCRYTKFSLSQTE
jgi:hypothetical protein